jgi:hypothetical protein
VGGVAYGQGDLARARQLEHEALKTFGELGDEYGLASVNCYLGMFAASEGKMNEAARYYAESLQGWVKSRHFMMFKSLVGLADAAAALGLFSDSAALLGATEECLRRNGIKLFPFDQPGYVRAQERSRSTLGTDRFAMAHTAGTRMSIDQWLELAANVELAAGGPHDPEA